MRRFQPIDIIGVVLIVALLVTAIRIIGDHLVSPEEEVGAVVEAPRAPETAAAPEAAKEPEAVAEPEAAPEAAAVPEMPMGAEVAETPEAVAEAEAAPEAAVEPKAVAEAEAAPEAAAEPEMPMGAEVAETPKAVAEPEAAPEPAAEMEEAAEETSIAARVAAADPAAGEQVFKKHLCFGCHKLEPGKHGVGPSLAGFFGHKAAQAKGFKYSKALQGSGIVWTPENLDRWVADPKAMVKGTKMILPKPVKDAQDRADLIAYLEEATSE